MSRPRQPFIDAKFVRSVNSKIQKQLSSHSIWTRTSLLKRLSRGIEAREKFVESQISNGIAFQIRALRNRKGWSQPKLAIEIETTQNQIYRLENPDKTRPNISTLKKIAKVFDVALIVQFVPFSQLMNWTAEISPATLAPNSFDQENQANLGGIPATSTDYLAEGAPAMTPAAKVKEALQKLYGELSWNADEPSYELLDKESTLSAWRELLADLVRAERLEEAKLHHETWNKFDAETQKKAHAPGSMPKLCTMCDRILALSAPSEA